MEADSTDFDKETAKLTNDIKELLGAHMLKFGANKYHEILVSCLTALAIQTGELRWLTSETEHIDPETFDTLFLEAVMKRFDEQKKKYGSSH